MMPSLHYENFRIAPYRLIWDRQRELRDSIVERKVGKLPVTDEYLLIGEHPPVYTLGFHGNAANLLVTEAMLQARGCECIRIERGGDITYHGPGQLIAYPIIDLQSHGLGVKGYIDLLEESVIGLLAEYGVKGERVKGATGVWLGAGTPREHKICAIGVKVTRGVTMHGFALNVNTDLSAFQAINPCGFIDKGVTSLALELGNPLDMSEVKMKLTDHLFRNLTV